MPKHIYIIKYKKIKRGENIMKRITFEVEDEF